MQRPEFPARSVWHWACWRSDRIILRGISGLARGYPESFLVVLRLDDLLSCKMEIKRIPSRMVWGLEVIYLSTWCNFWLQPWNAVGVTHSALNYMPPHYAVHTNILFYNIHVWVGVCLISPAKCRILRARIISYNSLFLLLCARVSRFVHIRCIFVKWATG